MKTQPVLMFCTLANLLIMVAMLLQVHTASADSTPPVLRARALQIVDDQGRVRASIGVYPASRQKGGDIYPETVLLRLLTERGRPSIKLGVSEESAVLDVMGPTGTQRTYVQLEAKGTRTAITLKDEDGRELVTKP